MILTLTKRSQDYVIAEIIDETGQTIYQKKISRYNESHVKWLSRVTSWSIVDTTTHLNTCCDVESNDSDLLTTFEDINPPQSLVESWTNVPKTECEVEPQSVFTLYVREINQLKSQAATFKHETAEHCLRQAFDYRGIEPLLEWMDDSILSCLDIDYHNFDYDSRPNESELSSIFDRIKPQPFCWHPSHGRGAKLYYVGLPGYSANELAAIGGFSWIQADPRATFEITKSSRHPCHKRSFDNQPAPCPASTNIYYSYGQIDLTPIKRLFANEVSLEDIHEYLHSQGWTMGQSLPHNLCPISPDDSSKACLFVGERGLFCHKCSAKGLGTSGIAGFIPYSTLVGTIDNRIRKMVRHFVHFEHARIVLGNIYPSLPLNILENIYRIMLKICHTADDPRINMAMKHGKGFVRVRGNWVSTDGECSLADGKPEFVNSLPITKIPIDEGFAKNPTVTISFLNSCDLSEYGYEDITFIRGCKVYGQFLPYRHGEIVKVNHRKEFNSCPPTYIPKHKRMPEDESWGLIESEFPGIDRVYLKLLIATKGAAEGRLCQCPFILVTGPAGSGKSTTPHIAAGICGDKAEEPIWVADTQRFRQNLMESSRHSSFVVVNEIFKESSKLRISPTQALDPMLSLTEDSRSWEMYVGQVAFGRLPVFVCTDVNIPPELRVDIQIARRFTFLQLTKRNYWSDTFVQKGIRPHEFRLISKDHNEAANGILSDIIDEFFKQPTSLADITERLELKSFEEQSEEVTQTKNSLKVLYDAVLSAPQLEGSDAQRYTPEKGWKKIDRSRDSVILKSWEDVCDGVETSETWGKSRSVDSEDWSKLLGTDFPVVCDVYKYRPSVLYIRFRSNDSNKTPFWINGKQIKERKKK